MAHDTQIKGADLFLRQKNQTRANAPLIICDGLQTPENLGSILRAADATGSKGIILLDSDMDLKNKKLSKIARSTNQNVSIRQMTLQQFSDFRIRLNTLFALEITHQSKDIFATDIINCDAILLGHESTGIREESLALCDGAIHLPMFGINGSMNISHAVTVFLYEWRRQTRG